jgi:hypothetical protein
MAKTNALDPKIEYGMLGETAMDEIRALVSGLGDHATFAAIETGAVKLAPVGAHGDKKTRQANGEVRIDIRSKRFP